MLKNLYLTGIALLCLISTTLAQNIGIHVTKTELELWKKRTTSGPYKTSGDMSPNSPGDWTRIINNANQFIANPSADRYLGGSGNYQTEPHSNHIKMRDAAFVYLLTGDKKYFDPVKKELLAQIAVPVMDCSKWELVGDTHRFTAAEWFVRLLFTYDYIKAGLTSAEKSTLNKYFLNVGKFYANNINHYHEMLFPNRLKGDYSVKGRDAESGRMRNEWTHINKNGSKGNQLSYLSSWYNNRKASMMRAVGLIGVFLNDQDLIKHSKIFIKEMIMFSVYPDGTMGEYERNGDYGNPQAGMVYSGINIQMACEIADALARKGDLELYNYTTSEGLWGTQGGKKNIKLMVQNFYNQVSGAVERFHGSVDVRNRIDIENEFGGNYGIERWVHDIWFAMSNTYWKDSGFRKVYRRQVGPKYPDKNLAGCGSVNYPWSAAGAVYPGVLFMFDHELDIYNSSPAPQPDPKPTDPVPGPDPDPAPSPGASLKSGLEYSLYEGDWNNIPDFSKLTPVKKGITSNISLKEKGTSNYFGLQFKGFIKINVADTYKFTMKSDDGSRLKIAGTTVINHDGTHAASEKTGSLHLAAGYHPIEVAYFEKAGDEILEVYYQSSSMGKVRIPDNTLFYGDASEDGFVGGLNYKYYEGSWNALPDFSKLKPVSEGVCSSIDLNVSKKTDNYGLVFEGYIRIATSGSYNFYLTSDDGSRLYINNKLLINNDDVHAAREYSASINLASGYCPIRIEYFEKTFGEVLELYFSSSTMSKVKVPSSALFRRSGSAKPSEQAGLQYVYYEGYWDMLPDFSTLAPVKKGVIENFLLTPKMRNDGFAIVFSGYLNIPASGTYTFYLSSDDGSKLIIDGQEIIVYDGTHPAGEKSASVNLSAGRHHIKLPYFEKLADESLTVQVAGPGVSKQVVPSSWLTNDGSSAARIDFAPERVSEFKVYPNPFRDRVFIRDLGVGEALSVTVYNHFGKMMYHRKFGHGIESEDAIDLSNLTNGLYLVKVEDSLGGENVYKMIKE